MRSEEVRWGWNTSCSKEDSDTELDTGLLMSSESADVSHLFPRFSLCPSVVCYCLLHSVAQATPKQQKKPQNTQQARKRTCSDRVGFRYQVMGRHGDRFLSGRIENISRNHEMTSVCCRYRAPIRLITLTFVHCPILDADWSGGEVTCSYNEVCSNILLFIVSAHSQGRVLRADAPLYEGIKNGAWWLCWYEHGSCVTCAEGVSSVRAFFTEESGGSVTFRNIFRGE